MTIFKNEVKVTKNSYKDEGDGIVSFPNGLCISDDQVQRNGTRYDIDSLDTSHYSGMLTADHEDKLKNIIGRVEGIKKEKGRLTVNRIVYAVKQNPYARLAYDLLVGGFSNAFSTETMGASNEVDGVLANHELVGLSQVVCPNNYSAVINTVRNSLNKAKEDGLDINGIEDEFLNKDNKMEDENKLNNESVEDTAKETDNAAVYEIENKRSKKVEDEDEEKESKEDLKEEIVEIEDTTEDKEDVIDEMTDTKSEEEDEEDEKKKKVAKKKNEFSDKDKEQMFRKLDEIINLTEDLRHQGREEREDTVDEILDDVNEADKSKKKNATDENVNNKEDKTSMNTEEIKNCVEDVLRGIFKNEAKAPEFKKAENSVESNDYANMDWQDRYNKQVNAAYEAFRLGDIAARTTLNEINKVNFNELKKEGIARNSMTIASMGNFVIPPEMYREIIGKRTDYSAILDATDWRETRSLEFAWLKRNGDIDMKNVAMCDDGNNGNLKPMSEYTATPVTSKLEEMAAVTVVCNAATRFFAVDLLADVAAGYRNDYDRKRAQLVIARLEQAVDENGQSVKYAPATDTEAMLAWLEAIAEISDTTTNGKLIFNNKTWAQLKAHALAAGTNGPLSQIFTDGELPQVFGTRIIVVPNDLMPTIESDDNISFLIDGEEVKIDHAVFYADLSEFTGYTSGGLQYDISADASYEVNGATRSAYQRNEMVLRGSFFRGGAIKDTSRVSGILQQAA